MTHQSSTQKYSVHPFSFTVGLALILATASALIIAAPASGESSLTPETQNPKLQIPKSQTVDNTPARAIFAGGCFWCMEEAFERVEGVSAAISGYIGGHLSQPSYQQVSSGGTGHTEAIEVLYNPKVIDYQTLLSIFWSNIDPLDAQGQFCDKGSQYRSGIFFVGPQQHELAQSSKDELSRSQVLKGTIQTEITAATTFYPAEDYHQDYYLKNPNRYQFYKWNCGRKQRLTQLWGKAEH